MRRLLLACPVAMLFSFAALLARAQAPIDALRACRNEVAARYLNIPMANISVQPGDERQWVHGELDGGAISRRARRRLLRGFPRNTILRFETTGGPTPGGQRAAWRGTTASR